MLRDQSRAIIDSSFLAPFVEAWMLAERRNPKALDTLAQVPPGSALAAQLPRAARLDPI